MKIGFISLGCSKNLVDTEWMMGSLKGSGHVVVNRERDADVIVINTCGFIGDAREEAIDTILETARWKDKGALRVLIAAGCLVQNHANELMTEIPELDGVIGVHAIDRLVSVIDRCLAGNRVREVPDDGPLPYSSPGERLIATGAGWAYLKIAEGCSNRCTYCAIPGIRGGLRSRGIEEITEEAAQLAENGVRELIVIAQDTTAYGTDLGMTDGLAALLSRLNRIDALAWIRVMYVYPASITPAILDALTLSKVVPYLDIPVQHASEAVLRKMGRRYSGEELRRIIAQLRERIPGLTLRTTLMTGFPGETEADHQENVALLDEIRFDWAGVFSYSPEPGTPAAALPGPVSDAVKQNRLDQLMMLQKSITADINRSRIGTTHWVLVESPAGADTEEARAWFQAPEVDGHIRLTGARQFPPGSLIQARITAAADYDLKAVPVL
ncbi:MAG: 30S ribosomal protein S12 methylthiotransferase RimO [Solirubrobacterales bacterium]